MYSSSRPPSAYQYNPQTQTEDDDDSDGDLGSSPSPQHHDQDQGQHDQNDRHDQDYPQHGGAGYGYGYGFGRQEDPSDDRHHYSDPRYKLAEDDDMDDTLEKDNGTVMMLARNSNYKPVPLRWPFITTLMTLFLLAIGMIIYAHISMPHSDSTAHVSELKARRLDAVRADDQMHKRDAFDLEARPKTPSIVVVTTEVPYTITPTVSYTVVTVVTNTPTQAAKTTPTVSHSPTTLTFKNTLTINGSTIAQTHTTVFTDTGTLSLDSVPTEARSQTMTVVTASAGHPYISYGKITLTVIDGSTVNGQDDKMTEFVEGPKVVASEKTVLVKTVSQGATKTIVSTPDAVTVVSTIAGGVRTSTVHETDSLQLHTVLSTVGGTTVTVDRAEVSYASVSGNAHILETGQPKSYQDGIPTVVVVGGTVVASVHTSTHTRTPAVVIYTTTPHTTAITSKPKPTTLTTTQSDSTIESTAVSTVSVSVTPSASAIGSSGNTNTTGGRVTITVLDLQPSGYFVATFLPTIVAIVLSLPLRVIDANAKMYQPFQALTRPGGARGSESLTLEFSGLIGGIRTSWTAAWYQFEFIPLVTTTLVLLSSLMAPLATEALGLKLHGSCSLLNESGCAGALGVSVAPAFALVGVLSTMFVLLGVLLALLGWRRWRTGVRAAPWNLAGLASLTACPDLVEGSTLRDRGSRRQQRSRVTASEKSLKRALAERQFALGVYETEQGRPAYGIVPVNDTVPHVQMSDLTSDTDTDRSSFLGEYGESGNFGNSANSRGENENQQPFLTLTVAYRVSFIVFLAALLAVDLAYHIAAAGGGGSNPITNHFGYFVATNSFGVGFVMAAVGVAISFGWAALLATVATIAPFQAMAMHAHPQPAERSILLPSRPTNEFSSLWTAYKLLGFSLERRYVGSRFVKMFPRVRRANDAPPIEHAIFLGLVAVMTLVSEFLPVLLANVPYRATQTRDASVACARAVAVVLVLMLLTLIASFVAVRWPALPADPRTLAGSMYYVVDSHSLPAAIGELEEKNGKSMSLMTTAEKELGVQALVRRYYYSDIIGRSGRRRLAVDADVTFQDPVVEDVSDDDQPQQMQTQTETQQTQRPAFADVSTAYQGGPYYVNDHDRIYQRQQQADERLYEMQT